MKWIAIHDKEVVGEFITAEDAAIYKVAATKAGFKVTVVSVDDNDAACVIRMTGLYGMPDNQAYYRASGDCFNFATDLASATIFEGGRDNSKVQAIMKNAEFYLKQFNADDLMVVPFYQCTQKGA